MRESLFLLRGGWICGSSLRQRVHSTDLADSILLTCRTTPLNFRPAPSLSQSNRSRNLAGTIGERLSCRRARLLPRGFFYRFSAFRPESAEHVSPSPPPP